MEACSAALMGSGAGLMATGLRADLLTRLSEVSSTSKMWPLRKDTAGTVTYRPRLEAGSSHGRFATLQL